jgi:hypothetical protein
MSNNLVVSRAGSPTAKDEITGCNIGADAFNTWESAFFDRKIVKRLIFLGYLKI